MPLKNGPHVIPHDEKCSSRDDFEPSMRNNDGELSDDDTPTLVGSSKGSNLGSKRFSKGKLDPGKLGKDDDISKDVQIGGWIEEQNSPRKYRWPWILIIAILFSPAIFIPVLLNRLPINSGAAVALLNSTATTATAIPNEGFYVKSFQNGDLQLFYADEDGNLMSIQRLSGSWSSPVGIAKDAKIGTTISASVTYYHDREDDDVDEACKDAVYWRLFFVDKNDVVQELCNYIAFDLEDLDESTNTDSRELAGLYNSNLWASGPLSDSKLKTSESLHLTSCTPYQSLNFTWSADSLDVYYNYTFGADTVYLYYGSDSGKIAKVAYNDSKAVWLYISNTPSIEYASTQAIECTVSSDGIESIWVVSQDETIQQWWTDTTAATTLWNAGATYNGSISFNSSLHAISSATLDTVYFQAPNNSIMQLSVMAGADGVSAMNVAEVGVGSPGTRLMTDSGDNDAFYYLYFQNGSSLVQTRMQRNNSSGMAAAAGTTTLPTIVFAGVGRLGFSHGLCSLCFGIVLYLLL